MSLFQPRWLRRWIRRRTNPMPVDKAHIWKQRLSVLYGIIAWNAFGGVCYMIYTGRNDWAKYYGYKTEEDEKLPQAIRFSRQLNLPNAHVVKFSGFSKMDEYELRDAQVVKPPAGDGADAPDVPDNR